MSAIPPVKQVQQPTPFFIPKIPKQLSLWDFSNRFKANQVREAKEGFPVEYESSKPIVAPEVSECIALFEIEVDPITQQVKEYRCYHVDMDADSNAIDDFINTFDEKNKLYLYLIGGNEQHPDHSSLYNLIKKSLEKASPNPIIFEQIDQINSPTSTSDKLHIGLTPNGEIFWCYS